MGIIEIAVNPKNLDTKVITYDPTGERPSKFWTVRQAIQELDQSAFPAPKPEKIPEPVPESKETEPEVVEANAPEEVSETKETTPNPVILEEPMIPEEPSVILLQPKEVPG